MTVNARFNLGWEVPDDRDIPYQAPESLLKALPPRWDLREKIFGGTWETWDQGGSNSCTSQAVGGAMMAIHKEQHPGETFTPSTWFIYYNELYIAGEPEGSNATVYVRQALEAAQRYGACPEDMWPSEWQNPVLWGDLEKADGTNHAVLADCYTAAAPHSILQYLKVGRHLDPMRARLCEGFPVTIGLSLFSEYETAEGTGDVPLPKPGAEEIGGHAVLLVGYDDDEYGGRFIIRNSHGPDWGIDGYGTLPYDYATHPELSHSLWTVRSAS